MADYCLVVFLPDGLKFDRILPNGATNSAGIEAISRFDRGK